MLGQRPSIQMLPNAEIFVITLIYRVNLILQKWTHIDNVRTHKDNAGLANLFPKTDGKKKIKKNILLWNFLYYKEV